jgi:hypothetical protein
VLATVVIFNACFLFPACQQSITFLAVVPLVPLRFVAFLKAKMPCWLLLFRNRSAVVHVVNKAQGRAIAHAVIRWLPTAAARVRALSGHVRFVVDKVALGQVFS